MRRVAAVAATMSMPKPERLRWGPALQRFGVDDGISLHTIGKKTRVPIDTVRAWIREEAFPTPAERKRLYNVIPRLRHHEDTLPDDNEIDKLNEAWETSERARKRAELAADQERLDRLAEAALTRGDSPTVVAPPAESSSLAIRSQCVQVALRTMHERPIGPFLNALRNAVATTKTSRQELAARLGCAPGTSASWLQTDKQTQPDPPLIERLIAFFPALLPLAPYDPAAPLEAALGLALRTARQVYGGSQGAVAKLIDVDQANISRWESQRDPITVKQLPTLCELFSNDEGWITAIEGWLQSVEQRRQDIAAGKIPVLGAYVKPVDDVAPAPPASTSMPSPMAQSATGGTSTTSQARIRVVDVPRRPERVHHIRFHAIERFKQRVLFDSGIVIRGGGTATQQPYPLYDCLDWWTTTAIQNGQTSIIYDASGKFTLVKIEPFADRPDVVLYSVVRPAYDASYHDRLVTVIVPDPNTDVPDIEGHGGTAINEPFKMLPALLEEARQALRADTAEPDAEPPIESVQPPTLTVVPAPEVPVAPLNVVATPAVRELVLREALDVTRRSAQPLSVVEIKRQCQRRGQDVQLALERLERDGSIICENGRYRWNSATEDERTQAPTAPTITPVRAEPAPVDPIDPIEVAGVQHARAVVDLVKARRALSLLLQEQEALQAKIKAARATVLDRQRAVTEADVALRHAAGDEGDTSEAEREA